MPIKPEPHNRRQLRLLIVLLSFIVVIGGWEVRNAIRSSSHQPASVHADAGRLSRTRMAISGTNKPDLRFTLRVDIPSRSENVEYSATSRNVFSAGSSQVVIESPIAPARPLPLSPSSPPVPDTPKVPSMNLAYLGFAQSPDKILRALFVHGDDIFMATTGDIMFHRFKVGLIQPASVEVTDLSFNNTQTIALTTK